MGSKLLNVAEAAQLLGIGVGTLYHWVSEGRIPHVKLSLRCLRFRREDLERWIAKQIVASNGRDP